MARDLVKDAFKFAGEDMPKESFEERIRKRQVTLDEFTTLDDLSDEER